MVIIYYMARYSWNIADDNAKNTKTTHLFAMCSSKVSDYASLNTVLTDFIGSACSIVNTTPALTSTTPTVTSVSTQSTPTVTSVSTQSTPTVTSVSTQSTPTVTSSVSSSSTSAATTSGGTTATRETTTEKTSTTTAAVTTASSVSPKETTSSVSPGTTPITSSPQGTYQPSCTAVAVHGVEHDRVLTLGCTAGGEFWSRMGTAL